MNYTWYKRKRATGRFFLGPFRLLRHRYIKSKRGFSDFDAFNGDGYLAGQIAGILEWIIENGHGVSMAYADDTQTPVDIMVLRRDREYKKYIEIFREYEKNGAAWDEDWKKEFGGLLDNEVQDALEWFKKHFQELWD